MTDFHVHKTINAPAATIFDVIAHAEKFSQAVPDIIQVEIISQITSGVGTRFRETRRYNGREATVELEITDYVPDKCVRLVSDTNGTVWDSLFSLEETRASTHLRLHMTATPRTLLARLTTPMIKGVITKALNADMDAVKAYCESHR